MFYFILFFIFYFFQLRIIPTTNPRSPNVLKRANVTNQVYPFQWMFLRLKHRGRNLLTIYPMKYIKVKKQINQLLMIYIHNLTEVNTSNARIVTEHTKRRFKRLDTRL